MRKPLVALVFVSVAACADPEKERLRQTTIPTYDKTTGRLTELTYDSNKDGKIDTWTQMDGARPILSRIDRNQDGKIDRWEYHDEKGQLSKVGFSRGDTGKPDAWAFSGPDGRVARIEVSSAGDDKKIDRWEHYDATGLVRAEDDTNGDGRPDKWETYANGAVSSVTFDENHDGKPDRRLTYDGGSLVLIESEPDAAGNFTRRAVVK
jgi:hypothetical protein